MQNKEIFESEDKENDIFVDRESVNLTPRNACFYKSPGGLVSMKLINQDGTTEFFERVVPVRAFPVTSPNEFISIKEPDIPGKSGACEIGMIYKLSDFNEEMQQILSDELFKRYFLPCIEKINSVKEKFGYIYFDVETKSGHSEFVVRDPMANIKIFNGTRIQLHDINGSCFEIPDTTKLNKSSYKKIQNYI